jgi:predicted nucleic acid-binding protein
VKSFVDTSAFLALLNVADEDHATAVALDDDYVEEGFSTLP